MTHRLGGSTRAYLSSENELASLMADVDSEDALIYLPMHSEMDWDNRQEERRRQDVRAQWDGLGQEQ